MWFWWNILKQKNKNAEKQQKQIVQCTDTVIVRNKENIHLLHQKIFVEMTMQPRNVTLWRC